MSTLPDELRFYGNNGDILPHNALMLKAADEIERLLKTNEGLRREWRRTETEADRLRADNERLFIACEAATYYIGRLEEAQEGRVVRDLGEAKSGYENSLNPQ